MYRRFSGIKWLILHIVTFGIYTFITWAKMTNDHNKMAAEVGVKKIMGFFPAFLLACITCGIFEIVWMIQYFLQQAALNEAKGANIQPSNGFLMFLMSFIPVYSFIWMANAHNELADAYEATDANANTL